MTGPEHYRKAELYLAKAETFASEPIAAVFAARAQVHATLALAAATALTGYADPDSTVTPDEHAWAEVAGVKADEAEGQVPRG